MTDELQPISKRIPTKRHRLFIDKFFERNMNGTKAYQDVYECGYDTARANAAKLLATTNISEEIERRLEESTMSANEVLARLADEARASIADFLMPDSLLIDPEKVHELGHLVKSLTYDAQGRPKIVLHDAQSAKQLIGRNLGMFKETSTSINIDLSQLTIDQLERIAKGEDVYHVLATTSKSGT